MGGIKKRLDSDTGSDNYIAMRKRQNPAALQGLQCAWKFPVCMEKRETTKTNWMLAHSCEMY